MEYFIQVGATGTCSYCYEGSNDILIKGLQGQKELSPPVQFGKFCAHSKNQDSSIMMMVVFFDRFKQVHVVIAGYLTEYLTPALRDFKGPSSFSVISGFLFKFK